MTKKALITGITGQDGSYLAEFLLDKGYEVHGIKRRASSSTPSGSITSTRIRTARIPSFKLHYGDLTDTSNLTRILARCSRTRSITWARNPMWRSVSRRPNIPPTWMRWARCACSRRSAFWGWKRRPGSIRRRPRNFTAWCRKRRRRKPRRSTRASPYAVAKLYAYWITVNYREAYGMYACNGILFNHESPRRGETFVTRKITRGLANIAQGLEPCLYMGNIDRLRDWGHAKDYVRMQWMMLQQDEPEDFVIATGVQYSVREFITWSAAELGVTLRFHGTGVDEIVPSSRNRRRQCPCAERGDVVMRIDPRYFRPAEVETLLGDPTKAKQKLGWEPQITAQEMCAEMVAEDLTTANATPSETHGWTCRCRSRAEPHARVILAGHRGMVGGAILRQLQSRASGSDRSDHPQPGRAGPDRSSGGARLHAGGTPDVVILAAAKVGGILANNTYPGGVHLRKPDDRVQRHPPGLCRRGAAPAATRVSPASTRSMPRSR